MLEKLARQMKDLGGNARVNCALSGGADSMALLWGLYLLGEKLGIELHAAHFNHHLRGAESDRDEQFVREFCGRFDIPLHVGQGEVKLGPKGLEAAAREARYAYFERLPGITATAHTADDNAETVLMHLVRGTGLKGLGGIAPVRGRVIRPMLGVTRQEVLDLLKEYSIPYVEDSSNAGDDFLRNRIRHYVMPQLKKENPRFSENTSAMALRLRQDEECLGLQAAALPRSVPALRQAHPALRGRALEGLLKDSGVKEPEAEHIALAESLVYSDKPSARGSFPGGVTLGRQYDKLVVLEEPGAPEDLVLKAGDVLELPDRGLRVICREAEEIINTPHIFTVQTRGEVVLRCRRAGDAIRLRGGFKTVKKLFIDKKIPARLRPLVPVLADEEGVLGVYGFGADLDRAAAALPALQICLEEQRKEITGAGREDTKENPF